MKSDKIIFLDASIEVILKRVEKRKSEYLKDHFLNSKLFKNLYLDLPQTLCIKTDNLNSLETFQEFEKK